MKCPVCGQWNRATLPKCVRCGAQLQAPQEEAPAWVEDIRQSVSEPVTYVEAYDGEAKAGRDPREELASEMDSLRIRHAVGDQRQFEMRRNNPFDEFMPLNSNLQINAERENFIARESSEDPFAERDARDARDDLDAVQKSMRKYNSVMGRHSTLRGSSLRARNMTARVLRGRSRMGLRRVIRLALIPLLIAVAVYALKTRVIDPTRAALSEAQSYASTDLDCLLHAVGVKRIEEIPSVSIFASILNDMAAHTIEIPGSEGARIMVRELKSTYVVVGGYATIEIPDYYWYENETGDLDETMDVELTPYLVESAGVQKPLAPIRYTIDVPLSPITMVTPASTYQEVATTTYKVSFIVNTSSQVTINGEDYSDLVNTQNGSINYNASVKPVGENYVTIEVRSQYYRKNTVVITLYRAEQDIPIDLMTTISDVSNFDYMTVKGSTLPGDTRLTILSPHKNLITTDLRESGTFQFTALFSRVGTNTIEIQAEYPGLETSSIRFDVYYLPFADVYTRKAWGLDTSDAGRANYAEFLNNTDRRVKDAQIYQCTGTIIEMMSDAPQLALMECGTAERPLRVLLENQSETPWEIGQKLKIFADAYGKYNGIPRLTARYTYPAK